MKIFKIILCEALVNIPNLFWNGEEMQTEAKELPEVRVYRPRVNKRLCIGCGDCVVACPINKRADISIDKERTILSIRDGMLYIENLHLCDGCGICIEACLPKALYIEFPIQEVK